ncbi:MAG TPA: DUF2917 domain-containing protein [Burkholderiales bacterium]|nr:DUF2917 domain-containing protein [Burkholderiales bacterium]
MRIEFDAGNLHLSLGQTLKIQDGIGSTVCCRQGSLWLTEERRARDVVLGPGSCYVLSQRGIALIQALGEADVALA